MRVVRTIFTVALIIASTTPMAAGSTAEATTGGFPSAGCRCGNELRASGNQDPFKDATTQLTVDDDDDDWMVTFVVEGVLSLTDGHIVATPVGPNRFEPLAVFMGVNTSEALTKSFNVDDLWNPPSCDVGPIDTPADRLGITVAYDESSCTRRYTMKLNISDLPYSMSSGGPKFCGLELKSSSGSGSRLPELICKLQLQTFRPPSPEDTMRAFVHNTTVLSATLRLRTPHPSITFSLHMFVLSLFLLEPWLADAVCVPLVTIVLLNGCFMFMGSEVEEFRRGHRPNIPVVVAVLGLVVVAVLGLVVLFVSFMSVLATLGLVVGTLVLCSEAAVTCLFMGICKILGL